MIPDFPNFKKINIEDKKEIESYTHQFLPYSDFNFVSLWCWDIDGGRMISKLNDNLIVRFTDYLTREHSFAFLGDNKIKETAIELINFADISGVSKVLRFISENSILNLKDTGVFKIEEDIDQFDYIYSVPSLFNLEGSRFKEKRHSAAKFLREYPSARFELKKINDSAIKEQINNVLTRWKDDKKKNKKNYDIDHEEIAINRLLQMSDNNLIVSCVYIEEVMVGFSIDEILPFNYAISHFFKTDNAHVGISDFLNKNLAKYLLENGVNLWNWEQDLGIEHIRKSKISYRPVGFLKKYKVSLTYTK